MKEKSFESEVFDILTEKLLEGRLDAVVMQNQAYLQTLDEISGLTELIDKSDFTEDQRLIIDRLVNAHETTVNYYIQSIYQQAYKDCVSLLKVMNLLP